MLTLPSNCTGNLLVRPIRPAAALARLPAATERVTKPHKACAARTLALQVRELSAIGAA